MNTFVIGDIHGCLTALTALLEEVDPGPKDQLVFLGDYIDRGYESKAVLEFLIQREKSGPTVFLRGNHELMMLESRHDPLKAHNWQSYGGFDTLLSYGAEWANDWAKTIPRDHWKFLERTLRFYETPKEIFVHASLDPDLDMTQQPDWLLFWEFFERTRPHKSGKRIICGHTPQKSGEIKDLGFATCIDTAAVLGGWLTCLEPESQRYWQANERGNVRRGELSTHS
jgi:serine/threonine protein phosphatase 1